MRGDTEDRRAEGHRHPRPPLQEGYPLPPPDILPPKGGTSHMNIALITGASSGLGREYACQLSRDPQVQEIWAIARREDRLAALRDAAACPVRPIPWT